jgi:hypothetical protein
MVGAYNLLIPTRSNSTLALSKRPHLQGNVSVGTSTQVSIEPSYFDEAKNPFFPWNWVGL